MLKTAAPTVQVQIFVRDGGLDLSQRTHKVGDVDAADVTARHGVDAHVAQTPDGAHGRLLAQVGHVRTGVARGLGSHIVNVFSV